MQDVNVILDCKFLRGKQIRLNEKKSFLLSIRSITATGMFSNIYFEFSFLTTVYRQNNASWFLDKPTNDVCIIIYTYTLRLTVIFY